MEAAEIPPENHVEAAEIQPENQEEAAEIPPENQEEAAEIPPENQEEAAEIALENHVEAAEIPPENQEEDTLIALENQVEAAEIPPEDQEEDTLIVLENQVEAAEIPHESQEEAAEIPHENQEEAGEIPPENQEEAAEIPPENQEEAPLAPNLEEAPDEMVPQKLGPSGFLDRTEFLRLLVESLYSLGYKKSAAKLESRSGVRLESPLSMQLLIQTITGQWDACIATINSINNLHRGTWRVAVFHIHRQQFLELLGSEGRTLQASNVLRSICSLNVSNLLSRNLVLEMKSRQRAVRVEDRFPRRIILFLHLVQVLPSWIWVRRHRLEQLVEKALSFQMRYCWHQESPANISLLDDHVCSDPDCIPVPSRCRQVLTDHHSEVLFVQFSNNGEYLASSSRDGTVIIWTVNENDTVSLKHNLYHREVEPVSKLLLKWSANDARLLACGKKYVRIWNVETGNRAYRIKAPMGVDIGACAWGLNMDNIFLASCVAAYSDIYACTLVGYPATVDQINMIPEVCDLAVTPDQEHLVCACKNNDILFLSLDGVREANININHSITSLSLSKDGQSLIVNLNSEEIQEWSSVTHQLLRKYIGHTQHNEIIHSCFGGAHCSYVASGSLDAKIYIWNKQHTMPIVRQLSGHTLTVNSVSWNLAKPLMLASASSDRTVRIWVSGRRQSHP